MTGRMRTRACVAAALIVASGGCAKKVGGQVVAIVNGQEITQQELNAELGGATIPPGANRNAIMAQLLQRVIDRKLLAAQAKKDGLDQSPAYLAQVQRAQDAILINLLAAKTAKTVALPTADAASKFEADNPSMFAGRKRYQLQQVAFPVTNDPALAAKLKAAKSMDEITAALKAAGVQYQAGEGTLDTATIPADAATKIAALPAGEPFLVPQGNAVIASVIKSSEALPVSADQANTGAIELIRRQAVDKAIHQQLDGARASAKITYEQGFAPPKGTPTPATQ